MEKQKTKSKSAVQAALESMQILYAQDAVTSLILVATAGVTHLVLGVTSDGDRYIRAKSDTIPYCMRYNKRLRRAELWRKDLKFYLVSKYVQRYVDELWMQLLQAYSVQVGDHKTEDKDAD